MNLAVIFSRRHTLGSMFLRVAQWSAWSHCAVVDGEEVIEASAYHGVRVRPLAEFLAESSRHEVIQLPCNYPEITIAAARSQVGKRYDWAGVVGIGFRRHWQNQNRYFCSELVAWAQVQAGPALFRADAHRLTPRDLYLPVFGQAVSGI